MASQPLLCVPLKISMVARSNPHSKVEVLHHKYTHTVSIILTFLPYAAAVIWQCDETTGKFASFTAFVTCSFFFSSKIHPKVDEHYREMEKKNGRWMKRRWWRILQQLRSEQWFEPSRQQPCLTWNGNLYSYLYYLRGGCECGLHYRAALSFGIFLLFIRMITTSSH